ncbi:MAG: amidase, partial [Actinomycetes bacterium]
MLKWRVDVNEYVKHDAIGLAELVRRGDATASELVDVALQLIKKLNPALNAVVVIRNEASRRDAIDPPNGPFQGVPFLVKDMDGVLADEPNTSSSRSLVDWRPQQDSELFARYKRAGLMIVGKTNAPEFGIMGVTESELRGPCRNPWNLDHTPGGSSGGSAASVAARIVPAAHAGDGGGSIRIPASACGIFGIKPTRGRQPLGPYIGEGWDGLVVPHVVSRSVRDSAALLDVTRGADVGAPYAEPKGPKSFLLDSLRHPGKLRIGYSTKAMLGPETDPDASAATLDAVILLRGLGHELVEVDLPLDPPALVKAYLTAVSANVSADIAGTEKLTGKRPSPDMFELPTWFLGQIGNVLEMDLDVRSRMVGGNTT